MVTVGRSPGRIGWGDLHGLVIVCRLVKGSRSGAAIVRVVGRGRTVLTRTARSSRTRSRHLPGSPCRGGAGQPRVLVVDLFSSGSAPGLWRVEVGGEVKKRPVGRPRQRPQVLDAVAGRRRLFRAEDQVWRVGLPWRPGGVSCAAPGPGSRLVDMPRVGLSVIPSPRR